MEKYGKTRQAIDDNITWLMHFAYRITKATDTHSEYVMLIAFPWEQWLCKHASILCYTYIGYLV
jgi:hypothetical protein